MLTQDEKKKCIELKKKEHELGIESRLIKKQLNDCKRDEYKYGTKKLSLLELVKLIEIENKKVHVNDFLNLFPESTFKGVKVTRSHVFEALWIIIFVLRLDDLFVKDSTRVFYNSVEKRKEVLRFVDKNNDNVKKFFDEASVNESNKGGIVDIYFEDIKEKSEQRKSGYACENKCEVIGDKNLTTAYFYSSKYFKDDMKKGIGSFDIEKIFTEVVVKLSSEKRPPFKIGVLVDNIDVILKKQARSHKAAAELLKSDISYGTGTLNIYYQRLLNYLKKIGSKNLDSDNPFSESSSFPEHISPRLHQDLFIKFTENRIKKGNNKFIWGAVPRSGKSFMIGGLIAEKQPQCVLLILGAVSETHDQFREDVFEKYKGSFPEDIYDIIDVKNSREVSKFSSLNPDKKNIIIVSQQQLWQKGDDDKLRDYPELNNLLKTKDKMIFFDEIHQGASSNAETQQKILNKYVVKDGEPLTFPFIMVTATFIKPMLKYELLGKEKSVVLQWTYDMMQNMKTVANEDTQQLIIEEIKADRDIELGREKGELFKKLLDDYQKSGYTLIQLQEQYEKEPELSIICPALTEPDGSLPKWIHNDTNIRDIFNIEKVKSGQTQGLQELLEYIKKSVYGIGNPTAVLAENNFNVLTRLHSQLWFLPTKLKDTKSEEGEGEVEPMMRYLLSEVMKDKFFRDNFCFVLMHSKNVSAKKKEYLSILSDDLSSLDDPHKANLEKTMEESRDKICFSTICLSPNKGSKLGDKECLRKEECEAYNKKKSLIIFTGAKLRLGISLPCVDIAIHMDPIKSVDTIYQSMFRVLTPYPGKKKGFFIDLLKNRIIKFFYQYENQLNYNNSKNTPTDKLNRLRNLIFSHDLNGIMLKQTNNSEYVQEYTRLVNVLGLDSEFTFQNKSEEFKLNQDTARTLVESVFNDEKITEFYKRFDLSKSKTLQNKINQMVLKRGEGLLPIREKDKKGKSDKQKKELSIKEKREEVTKYFLNLIALFILFEDNNDDDCRREDVENGIRKIEEIRQIRHFNEDTFNELCLDSEESNVAIKCYLRMAIENDVQIKGPLTLDIIKVLLKVFNEQIESFKEMVKMIKRNNMVELINIYCNIKNSFLMVKKEFHPKNLSNEKPCSSDFIKNEKILKTIRERLTVRSKEKEQHGEVFTPPELVCEMLDTLPKNVWTNKHLTWLDPANGIGNFPVIVYYKLMDGLKGVIKDDKQRSRYIIEKMLFMVELNPVNVKVSKKIFKMMDPDATPNIVKANFLTDTSKWKRELGRDTFDIVMGNPPYQYKKPGNKKSQAIWPDFVESSINCLKENGYLLFVHPVGWRNIDGDFKKIFNLIQERDLQHLTMRTFEDGTKTFGGSGTNFDYYCLKNTLTTKNKTKINDIDRNYIEIDLNSYDFIPSGKFDIFEKLIKSGKSVDILYSSNNYETRPERSKYPTNKDKKGKFIYSVVNSITQKEGPKFIYTSEKNEMFVPKVIWSNGLGTYPVVDNKGDYGLTQFSYGIKDIPENLEFIKNAMNDERFIELMEYVKFTNNKYNYKIIGAFKKDFWKEFDYKSKSSKTLKKKSSTKGSAKKTRKSPTKSPSKSPTKSPSKPRKTVKRKKKLVISGSKTKGGNKTIKKNKNWLSFFNLI